MTNDGPPLDPSVRLYRSRMFRAIRVVELAKASGYDTCAPNGLVAGPVYAWKEGDLWVWNVRARSWEPGTVRDAADLLAFLAAKET